MSIKDFPQRLKEARENAGLNQSEFARLMNVTRAAVSKWEKPSTQDMSAVNLAKAANTLGLSLDHLMLGRETAPAIRIGLLKKALEVVDDAFKNLGSAEQAYAIVKAYGMLARGHDIDANYIMDEIITKRATEIFD